MPRSVAETRKRALARIQRLCSLGVGSEVLMPDLMREVARLVPFHNGWFGWVGPTFEFSHVYSPDPVSNEHYWAEYHDTRRETDLIMTFREYLSSPVQLPVVHTSWEHLRVDWHTFRRSDYYNDVFRPVGIHDAISMTVQEPGRRLGAMYLWRELDPAFGPRDRRTLESISGFVAHAMTAARMGDDALADSEDRALFVACQDGSVVHAGQRAQALLMMALAPGGSCTSRRRLPHCPPELARLCQSLAAAAKGEIGQPPPMLRLLNPWGEFVLRAYWLEPSDGAERTRHTGITIERRVPRALALHRRVETLPLTGREKQLCVLMVQDRARPDLAEAMGVSTGTIITHQSNIYAKLGVHSRAGLLATLLPG